MGLWLPCLECGDDDTYPARPAGVRRCGNCGKPQAVVWLGGRLVLWDQGCKGGKRKHPGGKRPSKPPRGQRGRRRKNTEVKRGGRSVKRRGRRG